MFPVRENKKLRPGEATPEERKVATQLQTEVLPIKQPQIKLKARPVTEEEKQFQAYITVRKVIKYTIIYLYFNFYRQSDLIYEIFRHVLMLA